MPKRRNKVSKAAPVNQAWTSDPNVWYQFGEDSDKLIAREAKSSPVETGISKIASALSTCELSVYQELENGTYKEAKTTAAYKVLKKPNHFSTQVDLINGIIRDWLYYGNAYLYAYRNRRDEIVELFRISPFKVQPLVAENGDVYYSIGLSDLEANGRTPITTTVPARDVFHHRTIYAQHPLKGVSPLYAIGGSAVMNAAISKNMGAFHSNNSRPGGVLSIPGGLKQDARERLRREFTQSFGENNSGKTAVLDFDVKWNPMGYSAQESSVVELLKYSVEDICRALHIPRSIMGIEGASGSSVEFEMRQYYSHCLRPIAEALEARFDDFFELTGTEYEVEFEMDDLFRAETLTRVEALTKAIQGGVMSPNEARASEDLPPVPGGDSVFLQRQMTAVSLLEQLNASELASKIETPAPAVVEESNIQRSYEEPEIEKDLHLEILKEIGISVDDDLGDKMFVHKSDLSADILKLAGVYKS